MKRIPKAFSLGGHRFTVEIIPEDDLAALAGHPAYGLFMPNRLAIYLHKPTRQVKRAIIMQAFYHELFHAILWVANGSWQNEKYVDQLGHLMYQVQTTAEF